MKRLLLALVIGVAATVAQAEEAEYISGSPELHERVMGVAHELRCLVCQGQSLAESNSKFAADMRDYIKDMMVEGKSDEEVVDFMVQRYGDYVRYRPPVNATTLLLWGGPFLLLGLGVAVLYINVIRRKQRIQQEEVPLSEEEHRRAAALLAQANGESSGEGKA